MEIDIKTIKPFGPLMMICQLPDDIVNKLNKIVDKVKGSNDMGNRLAGQIKNESEIPHSMLEKENCMDIFHTIGRSYVEQGYKHIFSPFNSELDEIKTEMQSIWSVSQYENEYNPQHNHTHCQISAVLYLKIPEYKKRNIPNKKEVDGNILFTFCSDDSLFTTGLFGVKPKVGQLFIFPNYLHHQVYPFLGDGERRSIAYNMLYKCFNKSSGIQVAGDGRNLYNEINHPKDIPAYKLEIELRSISKKK